MKKLLAGFFLTVACAVFLSPMAAHAGGLNSPAFTYQTAVSSATTNIVTVSTSSITGATQVDNPQVPNRVVLEIQNIDASANLWCLVNSTMPVVNGGRKISAGSSWVVSVMDNFYTQVYSTITNTTSTVNVSEKIYCLSDGTSGTKAAVTQLY